MNIPVTILPNGDGSYTVLSNLLRFVTEGDSLQEALANAQEAAECHMEALREMEDADEQEYVEGVEQSLNTFVSV